MDFTSEMRLCLARAASDRIGVAVSGGSDSTALLLLMADWAKQAGAKLLVATVDHGLRPEAPVEARQVAKLCANLGIAHEVLHWTGWDHKGNLQDQARQARRNLLTGWARGHRLGVVALGHTLDDQAETVLMRLLRGSGVDGLAGMTRARLIHDILWIRPLLGTKRADLRDRLRADSVGWADDPSNFDDQFERIRARNLMAEMGLTPEGLAQTATRMQEARLVLEAQTQEVAREIALVTRAGDVELQRDAFFALPDETRNRLAAHCVKWVTSSPYRPRFAGLQNWLLQLEKGQKRTLAGCVGEVAKSGAIRMSREYEAVKDETCDIDAVWDGSWRLTSDQAEPGQKVAALGPDGLAQCGDWRDTGLPRNSLLASPAVWKSGALIAAPQAGWPQGWRCEPAKARDDFFSSVLSH